MAMPIETPSRIWRRIEEGEAHEVDMPSLPSLPGFDDSSIAEVDSALFSPVDHDPPPRLSSSQPTPAVPHPSCSSIITHNPKQALSFNGSSLRENVHSREELDQEARRSLQQEMLEAPVHQFGSIPDDDEKTINGTKVSKSSNGRISSNSSPPRSRSIVNDKGEKASSHTYGTPGPFGPSPTQDLGLSDPSRKAPDPSLASTLSELLPPSSPPISISSDVSNFHSSKRNVTPNSEVSTSQEGTANEIVDGSQHGGASDIQSIGISKVSGSGYEQTSHGTCISRDPTFSSDEPDATPVVVRAGVHFHPVTTMLNPALIGRTAESSDVVQEARREIDELATPLPRRKSFLLSVVNSTTRPRLTFPTPHPRIPLQIMTNMTSGIGSGSSRTYKVGSKKTRLSHPLSHVVNFIPSTPHESSSPGMECNDTPDGVGSTSFVSTASSHDLTVHHRVNASFDPLTGPQGVGRFNAGKLNTYLHGLNRRLQEENELLIDKLRSQQLELELLHEQATHKDLSGVAEDQAAEQWMLEKEKLEQTVTDLEDSLKARENELAEEQAERMRDRERWKERMTEVEDGVKQIIFDLERRAQDAEMKAVLFNDVQMQLRDTQIKLDCTSAECQVYMQRAEQAEKRMASEKQYMLASQTASDFTGSLRQDAEILEDRLRERECALTTTRASLADKEKEASSLKGEIRDLESKLRVSQELAETYQKDAEKRRAEQRELKEELRTAQTSIEEVRNSSISVNRAKELERDLAIAHKNVREMGDALEFANEQVEMTSNELNKARSSTLQLEKALEDSEEKILSDNRELLELRKKLTDVERERGRSSILSQSQGKSKRIDEDDIDMLEKELAEANKEIGRLTTLLDQNPARKALDKAKEARIALLEKDNEELLDQLRARDPSCFATPFKKAGAKNYDSPMHRQLINLSLRTPRTPGAPLRNASWLMNMTGDISVAHLMDEINRLQRDLDLANESIDDKLDKLEEAGLGAVDFTKALEDARRRILTLESQLEEREARWPGRYTCVRCEDTNAKTPEFRDPNVSLQFRLTMVMTELEALRRQREEEIASSSNEKAALRNAANRLNIEIKRAREELKAAQKHGKMAEKSKSELQQDLSGAKKTIEGLERHLQMERSRLRTVSEEKSKAAKEKERVLEMLRETEQRMDQAKDRLFQLKEANIRLEAELKVERKTAGIEDALVGNRETIERLRQERSQLADKHFELQQRLLDASTNANEMASKHANLQLSYDGRRRELDRQAKEIESLRAALLSQTGTLKQAQAGKNVAHSEDLDLRSLATKLEYELKRIQQDASQFGHDLTLLRAERYQMIDHHRLEVERHQRETKQVRGQLRILKEQLTSRKDDRDLASELDAATESLRLRHNKECKGLFVQIRYLKAKFTRESALRLDLGYQKSYLLVLLSRFEKSEKRVLATIAQISSVASPTPRLRFKSLRTVALAIMFISRTRHASEAWRGETSAASAVAAALDDVRRARTMKA